jgi:hypothetical protein
MMQKLLKLLCTEDSQQKSILNSTSESLQGSFPRFKTEAVLETIGLA